MDCFSSASGIVSIAGTPQLRNTSIKRLNYITGLILNAALAMKCLFDNLSFYCKHKRQKNNTELEDMIKWQVV
jgi:hypothetical protein